MNMILMTPSLMTPTYPIVTLLFMRTIFSIVVVVQRYTKQGDLKEEHTYKTHQTLK